MSHPMKQCSRCEIAMYVNRDDATGSEPFAVGDLCNECAECELCHNEKRPAELELVISDELVPCCRRCAEAIIKHESDCTLEEAVAYAKEVRAAL